MYDCRTSGPGQMKVLDLQPQKHRVCLVDPQERWISWYSLARHMADLQENGACCASCLISVAEIRGYSVTIRRKKENKRSVNKCL